MPTREPGDVTEASSRAGTDGKTPHGMTEARVSAGPVGAPRSMTDANVRAGPGATANMPSGMAADICLRHRRRTSAHAPAPDRIAPGEHHGRKLPRECRGRKTPREHRGRKTREHRGRKAKYHENTVGAKHHGTVLTDVTVTIVIVVDVVTDALPRVSHIATNIAW